MGSCRGCGAGACSALPSGEVGPSSDAIDRAVAYNLRAMILLRVMILVTLALLLLVAGCAEPTATPFSGPAPTATPLSGPIRRCDETGTRRRLPYRRRRLSLTQHRRRRLSLTQHRRRRLSLTQHRRRSLSLTQHRRRHFSLTQHRRFSSSQTARARALTAAKSPRNVSMRRSRGIWKYLRRFTAAQESSTDPAAGASNGWLCTSMSTKAAYRTKAGHVGIGKPIAWLTTRTVLGVPSARVQATGFPAKNSTPSSTL